MLEPVQVEVEERDAAAVMHRHEGEGGARHGVVVAQTARHALGEVRFPHAEPSGEHKHVAVCKRRGNKFAQALGVLLRRAREDSRSLSAQRHACSSIMGSGEASAFSPEPAAASSDVPAG